ncbi:hypothetical protein BASA50_008284 [Batrachochytrium salamandrivorans]|uniref:DUF659 domain-containing protein n=1 Tax=Batrachochytrium salamandrivorans TaxID=1357716 RepID=A0ABQ8F4R0_9FUNG|nr:hypothetical protein BASA50_008284 [Batrachochytrium salamandrivorans]
MPRSKAVVDNHIEEIKLNACLTSDAWSNIKSESIVNYMLISDSSTFFLESVLTSEQSHDAKWIAQDMGRMIDSLAGKACFESLRKSEHVLHRIVSARDFIQGTGKQKESQQKIHDIITDAFKKTRIEDLIFDYGLETEQAQQMGKKEGNVSSVYQFCDQDQSQQESKECFASDVGTRETKTILQFWLVDGLEFP